MRIYLDMDGVLADCIDKTLCLYNEEYDQKLKKQDIFHHELKRVQSPGTDMTKYFAYPGFFSDLPVIEGAKEMVSELSSMGHELMIATAVFACGIKDKLYWLDKNFPLVFDKIYIQVFDPQNIGKNFSRINFIESKQELIGDFLLDDGIHNLINTKCIYPVLLDCPEYGWTKNEGEYFKVSSHEEFTNFVKSIAKPNRKAL